MTIFRFLAGLTVLLLGCSQQLDAPPPSSCPSGCTDAAAHVDGRPSGADARPPATDERPADAELVPLPPPGAEECPRTVAAAAATGETLVLDLAAQIGGKPVVLGVDQPAADQRIQISALRFFVSHPVLWRAGAAVPTDLVEASGKPSGYGIQLVDFEDPGTLALRLRAAPGTYDRLTFELGLSIACNALDPTLQAPPLDAAGGMTWFWGSGYLFIRLEGRTGAGAAVSPFQAHGGALPLGTSAPSVAVAGSLTVKASGARASLVIRLDDWVRASMGSSDLAAGAMLLEQIRSAPSFTIVTP
jgi:hypothetical protein